MRGGGGGGGMKPHANGADSLRGHHARNARRGTGGAHEMGLASLVTSAPPQTYISGGRSCGGNVAPSFRRRLGPGGGRQRYSAVFPRQAGVTARARAASRQTFRGGEL